MSKRLRLNYLVILVVLFSWQLVLPGSRAQASENLRSVPSPTPLSPHGTILEKLPVYKWTPVSGASNYAIEVYKGTVRKIVFYASPALCSTTCSKKPSNPLTYYAYKWRVRAKIGGNWQPAWSSFKYFSVSPSSFTSDFNGSFDGWARKSGGNWSSAASVIYTEGLVHHYTTLYRQESQFSDFDMSARVMRTNNETAWNFLFIRMGNSVKASDSSWYPGYRLGYSNNGWCAVERLNADGTTTPILNAGNCPSVKKNDLNILRIRAVGSLLKFFINGTLLKTCTDTSRNRGWLGVGAYKSYEEGSFFQVDWVKVVVIPTIQ